ncbi:MAG TPA: tetratricopeptide repeat protein [Burkholderiaceae bacterium]|nr:tetratricopeptide repeat protein [Burkholderiaceae bacterium]
MAKPGAASTPPSTGLAARWLAATAHHQAGRLAEAEAAYRHILGDHPQHFDARHHLGVVALQQGRLDESQSNLVAALALNPRSAAAHNNLGNVHLRRQRLDEASASFQRAVELQPGLFDARLNLGLALRGLKRLDEAAAQLRRAVAIDRRSVQALANHGAVLLDLGDAAGAVQAFEAAARLEPAAATAHANLGAALCAAGDLPRALGVLDRALKLDSQSVPALGARGTALARLGRYAEACATLARVAGMTPDSAAAHSNLGLALRDAGQPGEAIAPLRRALALDPSLGAAQVALGQALREAGREADADAHERQSRSSTMSSADTLNRDGMLKIEQGDRAGAEAAYERALALDARCAETHYLIGNLRMLQGRSVEALKHYEKALALDAGHAQARWALTMAQIQPVSASAAEAMRSRSSFSRMLPELDRWFDARRSLEGYRAVGSTQPFYLAYQAQNNRELLARYGALCARLMAPWQAQNVAAPSRGESSASGRRIRVGIASAHLHDHSVWNAVVKGWVRHLDRQRFDVILFSLSGRSDAETAQARALAQRFESGVRTLAHWVRTITESAPDILIYPEIGMDALTTKLASLRLAPVQAASWGHPQTTGLPTIDHYLSADDLEPADAESHYTENLVRLAGLGVCYEPIRVESVSPDLRALGLPTGVPLLLCPGQPFKYAPEYDALWIDISKRLPASCLVFFRPADNELGGALEHRLRNGYAAAGVDFDQHVRFIPFLDRARFYGLMKLAHVFLDSPGFSGFNTAMQAIECGLPIVALEGEFMRGRFGSALLRRLGLESCIATSAGGFGELVAALVRDDAWRSSLRQQVETRRQALWGHTAAIEALERFIEHALLESH